MINLIGILEEAKKLLLSAGLSDLHPEDLDSCINCGRKIKEILDDSFLRDELRKL